MGWKHIAAAFKYEDARLGETALHILLRIAWEMRDNDYSFPGTAYIAKKINVSRKTVQRAIKELSEAGAIAVRSGRFSGHRNHYYLTFRGAPPVDVLGGGGTDAAPQERADVPEGVGQKRLRKGEVGQTRPAEVGQPELDLGQTPPEGWDKSGHGEKENIQEKNNRETSLSQAVRNVPPPAFDDGPKQALPPVGTLEFKSFAVRFCLDAGAPLEEARRFYEHHQAEGWAVLGHVPLEIAALQWVRAWRTRDPRGWISHQLAEMQRRERHQ